MPLSRTELEPKIAELMGGPPPEAWHLANEEVPVPKDVWEFAIEPPRQPFPGVWEIRTTQGPYHRNLADAIFSAANHMDARVFSLPEQQPNSTVATQLLESRIGESPFAYVIGLGGRIMAFKIGEKWLDILCVLRRRVAPINAVWREMSVIMRTVNRRMPDLSGMTFHLDAGYLELGMTEPQRIMRPVVLISATFTPPERSSPVWVDAMVVPVTKLSDDDDDGFGSWRNHEFC